ncbi:hypothetical protein NVP1144O_27 [Vibrio phage 1.144.O._10N.286.45.B3]|nr:hypothetical protein NVP1144O_27 [Vibrio phage 1.144.O._10N.286.45.B3]
MNKETDSILESLKASGTHEMDLPYIEVKGDSVTIDGSLNVDDLRIIVSELDKQKPRTKTEFVKCEFASDKEKAEAFIEGGLRYFTHGPVTGDKEKDTIPVTRLDELLCGNGIYRKVETEIDERQEFIDVIEEYCHSNGFGVNRRFLGSLFDSGKFKLVE